MRAAYANNGLRRDTAVVAAAEAAGAIQVGRGASPGLYRVREFLVEDGVSEPSRIPHRDVDRATAVNLLADGAMFVGAAEGHHGGCLMPRRRPQGAIHRHACISAAASRCACKNPASCADVVGVVSSSPPVGVRRRVQPPACMVGFRGAPRFSGLSGRCSLASLHCQDASAVSAVDFGCGVQRWCLLHVGSRSLLWRSSYWACSPCPRQLHRSA